jgi:hypothetical protein
MKLNSKFDERDPERLETDAWAPPAAPMDMPRQVLEEPLTVRAPLWLMRLLRPVQHG